MIFHEVLCRLAERCAPGRQGAQCDARPLPL